MSQFQNMRYVRSCDPNVEDDHVYSEFGVGEILPPVKKPQVKKSNYRQYKCWISVLAGIIVVLLVAVVFLVYFVSI